MRTEKRLEMEIPNTNLLFTAETYLQLRNLIETENKKKRTNPLSCLSSLPYGTRGWFPFAILSDAPAASVTEPVRGIVLSSDALAPGSSLKTGVSSSWILSRLSSDILDSAASFFNRPKEKNGTVILNPTYTSCYLSFHCLNQQHGLTSLQ